MNPIRHVFILMSWVAISSTAIAADSRGIHAGANISTLGLGLEVGTPITEHFAARLVGNSFSYSTDYTDDEDN